MILGILQTGHVPDEVKARDGDYTALYGAMFPEGSVETRTFSVVDGDFPDGPESADAWLVTGSKHGAYEDHPWIPPLEDLIRAIRDSGKPMIGICFGHQIIAQALGGKVEKFDGGWSVGRRDYTVGGCTLSLNAWHQDQVVALPEGATVLGSNGFTKNAFLAHGPNILTMQPHPEFESSVIEELIAHRSDMVPADLVQAARSSLGQPNDNALIHAWLLRVLQGQPATELPFAKAEEA